MTKFERYLVSRPPVAFLLKRSKVIVPPGFHGVCLYDVLKFFFSQIERIGLRDRASAIAFNFIMAIPAAAIFLFTLLPYFPIQNIQDELFRFIRDVLPDSESRDLILNTMNDLFNKPKTGLLSIGFILALFYSSNAMLGVIRTFDASLVEKRKKQFMQKRLRAIKLTIVLIFIIIATLLTSIGQGALFAKFLNWLGGTTEEQTFWTDALRWVLVLALFFISIAYTYKYAPSIPKRFHLFSPGAVFATVLIALTTWLFSVWVQNFSSYNRVYGSIGALLLIMLLIFINSLMLLIGYELNVSINYLRQKRDRKVSKDEVITRPQQSGQKNSAKK